MVARQPGKRRDGEAGRRGDRNRTDGDEGLGQELALQPRQVTLLHQRCVRVDLSQKVGPLQFRHTGRVMRDTSLALRHVQCQSVVTILWTLLCLACSVWCRSGATCDRPLDDPAYACIECQCAVLSLLLLIVVASAICLQEIRSTVSGRSLRDTIGSSIRTS